MAKKKSAPQKRAPRDRMANQLELAVAKRLRNLGWLWDVPDDDLCKLGGGCDRLMEAVKQYMEFMPIDFQSAVDQYHGRPAVADGEVGPAAAELIVGSDLPNARFKRCPIPDNAPPDNAAFFYKEKSLHQAVERMQTAKRLAAHEGTGSLPAGCHADKLDGYPGHAMSVWYDRRRQPERYRANDAIIQRMIFDAFGSIGGRKDFGVYCFEVEDPEKADVHVQWRNGNSWIGLAWFNNGTCRDTVNHYRDPGWVPSGSYNDGQAELGAHEFGHNLNAEHSPQSSFNIMSPAISWPSTGFRGWHKNDHRTPTFERFFAGDYGPMPGSSPEPPQPPPTPSGDILLGGGFIPEAAAGKPCEVILRVRP